MWMRKHETIEIDQNSDIFQYPETSIWEHWNELNKYLTSYFDKQPSRGVLIERCSENMQQIYRRTPTPKCDFNEVAKQLFRNHTYFSMRVHL